MDDKERTMGLTLLRSPFPDHQVGKLCRSTKKDNAKGYCKKCGSYHGLPAIQIDYVGHAAVTNRLLEADPEWSWEPLALGANGYPVIDDDGGMWIKLTVCGVTKLGYGDAGAKSGPDAMKERIGDAIRNAAMRFGVALELWHKGELEPPTTEHEGVENDKKKEEPPSNKMKEEPKLSAYPDESFAENVEKWKVRITSGASTAAQIIAMIGTRFSLTVEQEEKIRSFAPQQNSKGNT
jgi:hypothetical protein